MNFVKFLMKIVLSELTPVRFSNSSLTEFIAEINLYGCILFKQFFNHFYVRICTEILNYVSVDFKIFTYFFFFFFFLLVVIFYPFFSVRIVRKCLKTNFQFFFTSLIDFCHKFTYRNLTAFIKFFIYQYNFKQ